MSRQAIWLCVAAMAILLVGWVWFLNSFDRVPVTEREPPQAEARRNRYLALERFLARVQRPVTTFSDAKAIDLLPSGGTLILDRNRSRQLNAPRVERLFQWVESGGYLIAGAEPEGINDPVLKHLAVRWQGGDERERLPEDGVAAEREESQEQPRAVRSPVVPVQIPGTGRTLKIRHFGKGLQATGRSPEWHADSGQRGAVLLHYAYGKGRITLVAHLHMIADNWRIGEEDHAELIVSLLERYGPAGEVMLATRLAVPALGEWLMESAWMVVLAVISLLVAWLWRIVPRFGGIETEHERPRRSLSEHLAAVGRFVWRSGGIEHWLGALRAVVLGRVARRHPRVAAMSPVDQALALAQITRLSREEVRFALFGRVRNGREFLAAVSALQAIERTL